MRAAEKRATLAERQAIPDVTVRLGYTYDTFVASGDQRQSLASGMEVPLPVVEPRPGRPRGGVGCPQPRSRSARTRSPRRAVWPWRRPRSERRFVAARIDQLQAALEKATALRTSMEGAAQQGGASQVDVLLARRYYQELLLERTELDADAYEAALKIREAAAMFPRPDAAGREATHDRGTRGPPAGPAAAHGRRSPTTPGELAVAGAARGRLGC